MSQDAVASSTEQECLYGTVPNGPFRRKLVRTTVDEDNRHEI